MKTAGSWLLILALAACGGSGGGSSDARPSDSFDRAALAAHLAQNVILPTYESAAADAAALSSSVNAWCDALGQAGEAQSLADAQGAWRTTMDSWQLAEVMMVGPAAMDSRALRDAIYSWPLVSTCAVDQDVMTRYGDPDAYDISTRTNNRRGLDTLEYVLFTESLEHTCPSQIAPAGWDALAEADRLAARCGFAADAAADLAATTAEVAAAWASDGGDYVSELSAGSTSALAPMEALNLISDALFYIDTDTKDMKLAEPAGITINSCGAVEEPCAAELESPHAAHSRENVVTNLHAARAIFTGDLEPGTGGLGFDDFLVGVGAPELAQAMTMALDDAIVSAEAVPVSLEAAIVDNREEVVAAHAAVKVFTDDLKSQFLTVLGFDAPDDVAGDND